MLDDRIDSIRDWANALVFRTDRRIVTSLTTFAPYGQGSEALINDRLGQAASGFRGVFTVLHRKREHRCRPTGSTPGCASVAAGVNELTYRHASSLRLHRLFPGAGSDLVPSHTKTHPLVSCVCVCRSPTERLTGDAVVNGFQGRAVLHSGAAFGSEHTVPSRELSRSVSGRPFRMTNC